MRPYLSPEPGIPKRRGLSPVLCLRLEGGNTRAAFSAVTWFTGLSGEDPALVIPPDLSVYGMDITDVDIVQLAVAMSLDSLSVLHQIS